MSGDETLVERAVIVVRPSCGWLQAAIYRFRPNENSSLSSVTSEFLTACADYN